MTGRGPFTGGLPITIRGFSWDQWGSLWELRTAHLAEHGIVLCPDEIPAEPEDTPFGSPEWDFDHIEQVYLHGSGGFWFAWAGDDPVGHVGGQDLGGIVELRRMYVRADHRRHGIGTRLVETLIEHCVAARVTAVELWTAHDGLGQYLYGKCGFGMVSERGAGFEKAIVSEDEQRMRLDLRHS
jgi:GNAT superfamily N-acetyltransferase